MSCQQNFKFENFQPGPAYEQQLGFVYGQCAQDYHASPFPMKRTQFDKDMIKKFCSTCGPGFCDSMGCSGATGGSGNLIYGRNVPPFGPATPGPAVKLAGAKRYSYKDNIVPY